MSREALIDAIKGLAGLMARSPENHAAAAPAFTLLTEALVELVTPARSVPAPIECSVRRDRIRRLVQLLPEMKDCSPQEIAERLGIKKSYYYELRRDAIREGSLQE